MGGRGGTSVDVWVEPRPAGAGTGKDLMAEVRMGRPILPSWPQRRRRAGVLDGRPGGARKVELVGRSWPRGARRRPLTQVALRYAFLLDKALLICKRRGDSYDLKNVVDLQSFQVRDDSSGERENKKVGLRSQIWGPQCWES